MCIYSNYEFKCGGQHTTNYKSAHISYEHIYAENVWIRMYIHMYVRMYIVIRKCMGERANALVGSKRRQKIGLCYRRFNE